MEFVIRDNRIFFTRAGETGVVSVPAEGCIRFQATASPKIELQDWTLLPKETPAEIGRDGEDVWLQTGKLKVRFDHRGCVSYLIEDRVILRERLFRMSIPPWDTGSCGTCPRPVRWNWA